MLMTPEDIQDRQARNTTDHSFKRPLFLVCLGHVIEIGRSFCQVQRHEHLVQVKVDSFTGLDTTQFDMAILVNDTPPIVRGQGLKDFRCVPRLLGYHQIMSWAQRISNSSTSLKPSAKDCRPHFGQAA